jgi:hypothetical protein
MLMMSDVITPPHSSSFLLTPPPHFSSLLLTPPPHFSSLLLLTPPPHFSSLLLLTPPPQKSGSNGPYITTNRTSNPALNNAVLTQD